MFIALALVVVVVVVVGGGGGGVIVDDVIVCGGMTKSPNNFVKYRPQKHLYTKRTDISLQPVSNCIVPVSKSITLET